MKQVKVKVDINFLLITEQYRNQRRGLKLNSEYSRKRIMTLIKIIPAILHKTSIGH